MTKKTELEQQIGNAVVKETAKMVAKEHLQNRTSGDMEINQWLEQAQALGQGMMVEIHRQSPTSLTEAFLAAVPMQPHQLRQEGHHAFLKRWSGGGLYRMILRCPGMPEKVVSGIQIDGIPLAPITERDPNNPYGHQSPAQTAMSIGGQPTVPYPMQQYMPPPFYPGQPPYNPYPQQSGSDRLLELMFAKDVARGGRSEETDMLKQQIELMQRQMLEQQREREQERKEQLHREEIRQVREEMARAIGELKSSGDDKNAGLLAAVAPIVTEMMKSSGGTAGQMLEMMRNQSDTTMGFIKMMNERPTQEDRILKLNEALMGNNRATVEMMGIISNSIFSQYQGQDKPAWLQIAEQVIEAGARVGEAVFGGGEEEEEEEVELVQHAGPAQVVSAPAPKRLSTPVGMPQQPRAPVQALEDSDGPTEEDIDASAGAQAGAAARAALFERAGGAMSGIDEEGEEPEEDEEGEEDFEEVGFAFDDAMQAIFRRMNEGAEPAEIAYKLWKHGSSGNIDVVEAWFEEPEEFTLAVLPQLCQQGVLNITIEQIRAIAAAVTELKGHLEQGGSAEDYRVHYRVQVAPPRRVRRPLVKPLDGEPIGARRQQRVASLQNVSFVEPSVNDQANLEREQAAFEERVRRQQEVADVVHPQDAGIEVQVKDTAPSPSDKKSE